MSDYSLDDRSSIAGTGKGFSSSRCVQTSSEAHQVSCPLGTGDPFPGVKRGRRVTLTTHLHLVSKSRTSRNYIPLLLVACMAVAEQLYFFFYMFW
jgi:hypothetical protein